MALTLKDGTQAPFSLRQAAQFDYERRSEAHILTNCPPRKQCGVCEGRLNHRFGSAADKTAKYRHQAANAGLAVAGALKQGAHWATIYALARRAGTYGLMVQEASV